MKLILFLLLTLAYFGAVAQNATFVRVYNLEGTKIAKGRLAGTTASSLQVLRGKDLVEVPVENIGSIKTKRSVGHNVLIGSTLGGVTGAISGAASADPDAPFFGYTAAEGAGAGIIFGLPVGAAIGGISALFKHSKTYNIAADPGAWSAFQLATGRVKD